MKVYVSAHNYNRCRSSQFPFLNPHLIKRANEERHVGPNAALVSGSEAYRGYVSDLSSAISEILEKLQKRM